MSTTEAHCPDCGKGITVEVKVRSTERDIAFQGSPILVVEFSTVRAVHYCEEVDEQ